MIYGLRQTVSLLLLAFGALLVLLGVTSLFASPPGGVSQETQRSVTIIFTIGGVIGLAMIAWGIYLRSSIGRGGAWPLWVMYAVLLLPLFGLAFFVGNEVLGTIGEHASSREIGRYGESLVMLLSFLFGPIILLVRRARVGGSQQGEDQRKNTEPDAASDGGRDPGSA